ncbi:LLM class flavin-dependent oxidoreductase [Streptomyces sp. WMMC500]|uniref:LLM class flavin-dependent oxidoreductase n=1 Tax=Streptomyces sp. WMMC500 TaxID=3015154 RepID=UPI00248CE6CB|nr:LLM class flavin-dependent oxidoreductase [Streptomyces sp. WMMC500]WBB63757.1 LLM class flavin-dependent oxidoreductase [Streptomyces sp. WMMC500]
MRFSVNIPNFGDFADPRNVATVAAAAEQARWDGLFVWDHVLHRRHRGRPFGDPWMLLTAAALATSRIRLGPLLTPVPRYRPQQLARQVATLDHLSGGRVIFGAGLGGPVEDEYRSFGDTAEARVLGERLDEGLDLLQRFWSGEPVTHRGPHYEAHDVTLLPPTVQQPRPPVWIGGFWPRRPPMRRAARWDGAVPLFETARHGHVPDLAEVRDLFAYVREHRAAAEAGGGGGAGAGAGAERPFEFVLGGATSPDAGKARDVIGPLHDAGATWWDERQVQTGPDLDRLSAVLRRVEAGPPVLG